MEVDPDILLFTQDSIKSTFRPPHEYQRIDDARDSILRGKKQASDFPRLQVVKHEGQLWSLDNRRLWVFKQAGVRRITVDLVPYNHHTRFVDLMENKPQLKALLQQGYWPAVRGFYRKGLHKTAGIYTRPPTPRPIYLNEEAEVRMHGRPPGPRTIFVNEETEERIEARPRPISIPTPDWHIFSRHLSGDEPSETDEDAEEPAGSHTKVLVALTILVVALTWANFGRADESKLLRVVNGMSGKISPPPTRHSWPAAFGRGTVSILFWVLNEIFGGLIPAVISWAFRAVWRLMWRLIWGKS